MQSDFEKEKPMDHYNFDEVVNRRNTNSMKWNVGENELPMWVADMDFETAPEVKEAIQNRAMHGCFGYAEVPESWYQAYIGWWKRRHHFTLEKDWLLFCTGVVPAVSSIVRKLTTPGEKVLLQPPVYNIFYNSIRNNGCTPIENALVFDGEGYRIDFEDLEEKLADPQTSLMLLCNPQNPSGKIWDEETLARIGNLCAKYHVTVVSDEIHCDLTDPGKEYLPFASVNQECRDNSITCISPTKAFNLAGLQTAAISVPNPVLRHKVWRAINTDEVAEPNVFAVEAAVAAFTRGEAWLDALRRYIYENKQCAIRFIEERLPQIEVVPSEATYLLWLHCKDQEIDSAILAEQIRNKTGLYLSDGVQYGGDGIHFLRMNIACSKSQLQEGLARLESAMQ